MENGTLSISVLELCCFEWFQNLVSAVVTLPLGFRAVLFRMVSKLNDGIEQAKAGFRAVLFRMVSKPGQ